MKAKSSSRCSKSSIQHIEGHPKMSLKTGCHKPDARRTQEDGQRGSPGLLDAGAPVPAWGSGGTPNAPALGTPFM